MTKTADTTVTDTNDVENFDDYWQQYGLKKSPFCQQVSAKFYHMTSLCQSYFDYLLSLQQTNVPLALVTGPLGCGKSSLLSQLELKMGKRANYQVVEATAELQIERFLEVIQSGFGLTASNESGISAKEQLDDYLAQLCLSSKEALLIIDDAHTLPLETLAGIFHLASKQSEKVNLSIMLFGESQIETRISKFIEEYEQDIEVRLLEFEPWDMGQTKSYVNFCLNQAGLKGDSPFSSAAMETIHQLSSGIPGRINRVATQYLVDRLTPGESLTESVLGGEYSFPRLFRQHHVKLISSLLLVGLTGFLWWHRQQTDQSLLLAGQSNVNQSQAMQWQQVGGDSAAQPTATQATTNPQNSDAVKQTSQVNHDYQATNQVANAGNIDQANPTNVNSSGDFSSTRVSSNGRAVVSAGAAVPSNANAVVQSNDAVSNKQAVSTTKVATQTTVAPMVQQSGDAANTNQAQAKPKAAINQSAEFDQQAVSINTMPATGTSVAAPTVSGSVQPGQVKSVAVKGDSHKVMDKNSVKHQDASGSKFGKKHVSNHAAVDHSTKAVSKALHSQSVAVRSGYTVQLVALKTQAAVNTYVKRHGLAGKVKTYQITKAGQPWYIVTYGHFASPTVAQRIIGHMGGDLKVAKPWVRPVASIRHMHLSHAQPK